MILINSCHIHSVYVAKNLICFSYDCIHEFAQALGGSEAQRSLTCCRPWGHKESDINEQLNNKKFVILIKMSIKKYYEYYEVGIQFPSIGCKFSISHFNFILDEKTYIKEVQHLLKITYNNKK